MPSIENFRKQAKRVLRWRREGRHTVAPLIRAHLPAFGELSDREILAQPFQLSDAQEVVARQNGFSSWQALLEGASQMPESQNTSIDIAFVRTEAQLFTTDMERSLSFYSEKLGFETQFAYGEPPFYAQVARGSAFLNLRLVSVMPFSLEVAREEQLLSATLCVESIKELFLAYQTTGVEFFQPLKTEPWGARTFIVGDPDGSLILFAG